MTTSTLTVPPAIWRSPRCPACAGVLTFDEQPDLTDLHLPPVWGCEPCGLSWPDGPGSAGRHTALDQPLCDGLLRHYGYGHLVHRPAYRDAEYRCIRPKGHEAGKYPAGLCAGFLVAGSDGIPRSRTWSAAAVVRNG